MHHFNIKRSRLEQKKILDYKCYKSTYNHKGQIQKKCQILNYKTTRNKLNIQLRNSKKDYYSTKIFDKKCNPKEAWKTINNILGRQSKPTVVNELKLGENSLTNTKDIAEGFND